MTTLKKEALFIIKDTNNISNKEKGWIIAHRKMLRKKSFSERAFRHSFPEEWRSGGEKLEIVTQNSLAYSRCMTWVMIAPNVYGIFFDDSIPRTWCYQARGGVKKVFRKAEMYDTMNGFKFL